MKHVAVLTCLLLLSASAQALQGNDCATKSNKMKPAERKSFMESCLAQAESATNVKEETRKHKNARCEQNAKNKKLQGGEKAGYVNGCMNKNEAATAANDKPDNVIPLKRSTAPTASNKTKPAQQKPASKKEAKRSTVGFNAE